MPYTPDYQHSHSPTKTLPFELCNVSMRLSLLLFRLFRFLLPPCIILTLCLYFYPVLYGCDFPAPHYASPEPSTCFLAPESQQQPAALQPSPAPFRLLALGDPQLEGDSSLPDPNDPIFPSLHRTWEDIKAGRYNEALQGAGQAAEDLLKQDIPKLLQSYRKRLDLLGNDYYLAHIYRTLHWWTQPTHVAVLGDLLGSQWISDDEFERRATRFWGRVFRGAQKVGENITAADAGHSTAAEVLGEDEGWARRVINVAGNHDVGYAGDLDEARVERFERWFGGVNWARRFILPSGAANASASSNSSDSSCSSSTTLSDKNLEQDTAPAIHMVILNSMNLDTPALSAPLQSQTYDFLNAVINSSPPSPRTLTLLLTHIPLHKPAGVCADPPFFAFWPADQGGGVREQNHLSADISRRGILEGIFGLAAAGDEMPAEEGGNRASGRNGLILTGHDHEGCDVFHYSPPHPLNGEAEDGEQGEQGGWKAVRWAEARELVNEGVPGVRELTVRSMMGEFGGNAGLVSAWWDDGAGEWRVEVAMCALGVQHFWWGVHGADLVVGLMGFGALVVWLWEGRGGREAVERAMKVGMAEEKEGVKGDDGAPDGGETMRAMKGKDGVGNGEIKDEDTKSRLLKDW